MARESDVLIVGGGIVGCAAARELATDRDVTVVEKGQLAAEATGLSAGLVTPGAYYPETPEVVATAIEFFEAFDGTHGAEFTRRPRLDLVTAEDEERFRDRAEALASAGRPVEFISPEAVRESYPRIGADGLAGAVEYRDAGWVDPYAFTTALRADAEARGAAVRTGTRVADLLVEDGSVAGIRTEAGEFRAPTVVVAAGWRTQPLLAEHVDLPIRPWEFSIAVLGPTDGLGSGFPMGRSVSDGVYFRPERSGDLLIGDGERPAREPERRSGGVDADESFRRGIAATVPELVPDLADAPVRNDWTGIEGITPDGRPIVDAPADGPDGLVVAQASALGIMTCGPMARGVRALVTGEEPDFPLERFGLDRFETRSPEFETDGIVGEE